VIATALLGIDGTGRIDVVLDIPFDGVVAFDLFEANPAIQTRRLADAGIAIEVVGPRDGLMVWVWMFGHG